MDPLNFTVGGHSSLLPKSMGGSRSLSLSRQSSLPGGGGSRAGTIHATYTELGFKVDPRLRESRLQSPSGREALVRAT